MIDHKPEERKTPDWADEIALGIVARIFDEPESVGAIAAALRQATQDERHKTIKLVAAAKMGKSALGPLHGVGWNEAVDHILAAIRKHVPNATKMVRDDHKPNTKLRSNISGWADDKANSLRVSRIEGDPTDPDFVHNVKRSYCDYVDG